MRSFAPACLLLVGLAAGVLAYSNSFSCPFFFDDLDSIPENPNIRQLWPLSTPLTTPPQTAIAGRPVVSLSLAINYAIGELNVWGYHALNLAVHLLSTLALFGVVWRTLRSPTFGERFDRSAQWLAFAVATIWMTHPLLSESVIYVVLRTELLMGLFYLLTLYCAVRGWTSSHRRPWFICAVVSCASGMGCKEVMVSAPLIVLLYDRAFVSGSFWSSIRRSAGLYAGLAASWIILILLMVSAPRSNSVGFGLGISSLDYLRTQAEVLVWYLRLCVWPDPLVVSYEWELARTFGECMPQGLLVAALLVGTGWAFWRRSWLGFVGAWFFLILAPTSSVVPIVTEIAGERRMYLPLAAVVVLFVMSGDWLLRNVFRRLSARATFSRSISCGLVVVFAALLGHETFQRSKDYQSVLSIWTDAVAKQPGNHLAHYSLGHELQALGHLDEAEREYRATLKIKPEHADSHNNLGLLLRKKGRTYEAIFHYNHVLRIDPRDAGALTNLGNVLSELGRYAEAIARYRQALAITPDDPRVHNALGTTLYQQEKPLEAIRAYREALRLDPRHRDAYKNLGLALLAIGETEEAIEAYRTTLSLNPLDAYVHNNLGVALQRFGKLDEAVAEYRAALRLKPTYPDALRNLASMLVRMGKADEAVEYYRALLRINPADTQVRAAVEAALARQRSSNER